MEAIKTILIAMSPLLELRGSIPIAYNVYHLSITEAFAYSIIGNLIPVIFLLKFLGIVSNFLSRRSYYFNRFFAWLFKRTRENNSENFKRWGELALVIFVAIPVPFTGAWTGSLCAFVFGIPFKRAFPLIASGVIIAGLIVSLVTLGLIKII